MGKHLVLKYFIALTAAIWLLSASCAPQTTPRQEAAATLTPPPSATGNTWQAEWEGVIKAAKKERLVQIIGAGGVPEIRSKLPDAVKERFGIVVETLMMRGPEAVAKISMERRAGIFAWDVILGGSSTMMDLKPYGAIERVDKILFHPEAMDEKMWWGGLFIDRDRMIAAGFGTAQPLIFINSDLVKPGEIKSLKDLLNPKWKGKIIMQDPTIPGAGEGTMSVVKVVMGEDFITRLVQQEPMVLRDKRQPVEWLARGKYSVGVGLSQTIITEFQEAGAPLKPNPPVEGVQLTTGPGGVSLMNGAPHPNAARLFINWILTKDGQTLLARWSGHSSRRKDVSNDWIDPILRPQEGLNFIPQVEQLEEFEITMKRQQTFIKETFTPLVR